MNKKINTTIAFSIIILLIIIFGYFIWQSNQFFNNTYKQNTVNENQTSKITTNSQVATLTDYIYKLSNDSCTIESCMLAPQPYPDPEAIIPSFGLTRIKGYFKKTTKYSTPFGCEESDGSDECKEYSSICEEFIITDKEDNYSPKQLGFKSAEKVIPIDIDGTDYEFFAKDRAPNLSQSEKTKLMNSSANGPVEIVIFKYKPVFMGEAHPCYADNLILKVY